MQKDELLYQKVIELKNKIYYIQISPLNLPGFVRSFLCSQCPPDLALLGCVSSPRTSTLSASLDTYITALRLCLLSQNEKSIPN